MNCRRRSARQRRRRQQCSVGLTRTAALEYIKRGIRVKPVNPGPIDTQITRDVVSGDEQAYSILQKKNVPIARAGRPAEIASAVLWLLQSRR